MYMMYIYTYIFLSRGDTVEAMRDMPPFLSNHHREVAGRRHHASATIAASTIALQKIAKTHGLE